MDEIKINKVQIRNLQIEDYDQLAQSFTRVYSDGSDVFWTHKQIEKLIRIFPEGQIVTVVDEKIVGCALSIIVNYDDVKTTTPMPRLRARKLSIRTIPKEISFTVSKCLSIRNTADCAWHAVCTNTARKSAKH